ncbi:MAG: hypothetical protein BJ554DRAFT_4867 [Olpidium bornovanus]|uniref:Uncharacterized protein n=1 Tax=Olpidium bornovanus TaxID=278681 RepID=A0A8H8DL98_9FUNG|nr:MAG: hypothetical protein BJ554DRAFT_4867 [Olpidium bornovanus]
MRHARAEGTTTPEGEQPELPTEAYRTPERRGRTSTVENRGRVARSATRDSILTSASRVSQLSAKDQQIVVSVLLRHEQTQKDIERDNQRGELEELKRQVADLQEEKSTRAQELEDYRDTVKKLADEGRYSTHTKQSELPRNPGLRLDCAAQLGAAIPQEPVALQPS